MKGLRPNARVGVGGLRRASSVRTGAEDGVVLRGEVLVGERRLARLAHEALLVPVLVLVVQVLRAKRSTLLHAAEPHAQMQTQVQVQTQGATSII